MPLSVVARAESSPGEPMTTITQLNVLMRALWAAVASFPPAYPDLTGWLWAGLTGRISQAE